MPLLRHKTFAPKFPPLDIAKKSHYFVYTGQIKDIQVEESTVSVVFRIDRDLKTAFELVAKAKDQTVSQLLRAYIRYEVERNTQKTAQKGISQPLETIKEERQPRAAPKQKNPPIGSKSALMGMFKKKG